MQAQDLWQLFLQTGSPEVYLMYNHARKMEKADVFNDSGPGSTGHSLQ